MVCDTGQCELQSFFFIKGSIKNFLFCYRLETVSSINKILQELGFPTTKLEFQQKRNMFHNCETAFFPFYSVRLLHTLETGHQLSFIKNKQKTPPQKALNLQEEVGGWVKFSDNSPFILILYGKSLSSSQQQNS